MRLNIQEDHIRVIINDDVRRQHYFQQCLALECFEEVVMGLEELCVKFDPELYDEKYITYQIEAILEKPQTRYQAKKNSHHLPISFDKNDALDISQIAHKMEMSIDEFQNWFLDRNFHIQMMGFQPGFAYLTLDGTAPTINRLNKPRSIVKAGSIGFLGQSACIYAHDSPGGWPIIGKVQTPIFDLRKKPPNLLHNNDHIIFISAS